MNALVFTLLVIVLVLPLVALLSLLCYVLWYTFVKDASPTQTYVYLPASWAGDTHKETDILPIGDREEKGERFLNCRTDSPGTMQVLRAKYLADKGPY